eukprot:COSAG01_NODE_4445_length_5016_cov_92.960545_3_plen_192_part_00
MSRTKMVARRSVHGEKARTILRDVDQSCYGFAATSINFSMMALNALRSGFLKSQLKAQLKKGCAPRQAPTPSGPLVWSCLGMSFARRAGTNSTHTHVTRVCVRVLTEVCLCGGCSCLGIEGLDTGWWRCCCDVMVWCVLLSPSLLRSMTQWSGTGNLRPRSRHPWAARVGESRQPVAESPWSQFTTECQRC